MTTRSTAASLFVSLRPDQWTKNLIVFAALIFAVKLLDPAATAKASAAFLIFCALSGAVYLFNDVSDRAQDDAITDWRAAVTACSHQLRERIRADYGV